MRHSDGFPGPKLSKVGALPGATTFQSATGSVERPSPEHDHRVDFTAPSTPASGGAGARIHSCLALPNKTSDILETKIMLGAFGCTPAFDTYFKSGSGPSTFGQGALQRVERFYHEHEELIERYRVPRLAFARGRTNTRKYSRAKVIDMISFIEGSGTE
jgi:hypothetical protein